MTLFLTINGSEHIDLSVHKDARKAIRHALQRLNATDTYSVALWNAPNRMARYADAEQYLQSAGDAQGMTLEVRCRDGNNLRLFAVGRRQPPEGPPHYVVKWDQFEVPAFPSEIWTHTQALPVYLAYLTTQVLPEGLHLRERQQNTPSQDTSTEPSLEEMTFAWLGLDHAIASVTAAEGGPLIPFAIQEYPNGVRHLARFMADTYENSVSMARRQISLDKEAVRALLAYDGYTTVDGVRMDAVLVEFYSQGDPASHVLAQRYQPETADRSFSTHGGPTLMGETLPLF